VLLAPLSRGCGETEDVGGAATEDNRRKRFVSDGVEDFGGVEDLAASRIWWLRGCGGVEAIAAPRMWQCPEFGGVENVTASKIWHP